MVCQLGYGRCLLGKEQRYGTTHFRQLPRTSSSTNGTPPILCIHGEKDFRILANQAMAAFDAAVMRGVPAELLIYPDENHWVLKPQNGVLWQRTFFEWLDKWLKPAK